VHRWGVGSGAVFLTLRDRHTKNNKCFCKNKKGDEGGRLRLFDIVTSWIAEPLVTVTRGVVLTRNNNKQIKRREKKPGWEEQQWNTNLSELGYTSRRKSCVYAGSRINFSTTFPDSKLEMNPFHKHKIMSVGYQVKQISESGDMENLNSLLKFWVWESGRKIDPATGVIHGRLSRSFSHFSFLRHRSFVHSHTFYFQGTELHVGPDPYRKGSITEN